MKNNIFINRYVMACAISIVIALVGFICMKSLPIEQYPNIAPPTVRVITSYTGADANTIMKSVVQPLEENINGVPDMTYMTSSASSSGDVSIVVYFKQGTDPDIAAVNVQNRVSRASALLPADVTKVGVQVMKQQSNILQIGAIRSVDGKYDDDFVANYIDINLKPRLMRITGVGDVMARCDGTVWLGAQRRVCSHRRSELRFCHRFLRSPVGKFLPIHDGVQGNAENHRGVQ